VDEGRQASAASRRRERNGGGANQQFPLIATDFPA
jgi:hypothetical protein